jgi:hypothetical protein
MDRIGEEAHRERRMTAERKIFSYEEAVALMPQVRTLTNDAVRRLEEIIGQEFTWDEVDELAIPQERVIDYERVVSEWASAVAELGIEVKGLWLIDFDSGGGYYCWRYPEAALSFFHGYDEGFSGRVELN